ncbi:ataxin-10 [Homalodisca vitripennis]|uniref:ataxin-10 n=1 Tax=Homalodisca vitripennis TaxID=197043 RepID=UPI001EEC5E0A|nr:ataxin-10 [Homalodisca vitripennis]
MEDPSEMLHRLMLEDKPAVDRVTECFRSLRNTCAGNSSAQEELGQQAEVLQDADSAISMGLSTTDSEEWNLCLRISAQFLGNLTVNNTKNQEIVWARFCLQLKKMAQHGDTKLTNTCLMVMYNILLGCPNLTSDLVNDQEFVRIICDSGADGMEFAQYIVEHMLTQDVDWSKVYTTNISVGGRLFILDVVENRLKQSNNSIPVSLVTQLASQFCQHSECILRTVADSVEALEPIEVATLLQLLASCSAHPPYLQALQSYRNFFINCAFLLKSIHMAGKEQNNCFSTVPKLSEADDKLQNHPAFGFKANLVRVLGNLCWKHKENQDMMNELSIIPLLLDCCNIDARNPFIIQWVVLAVRNLCEGNKDNQAVIAGMSRQGLVESAVLTELGITLHTDEDNNTVHIAPFHPR